MIYDQNKEFEEAFKLTRALQTALLGLQAEAGEALELVLALERKIANAQVAAAKEPNGK